MLGCKRILAIKGVISIYGVTAEDAQTEDGEGDLLEAIRAKVGAEVPIMVTLDLHANITQKMVDHATALFVCDYYPHTDMYETGLSDDRANFLVNARRRLSLFAGTNGDSIEETANVYAGRRSNF